MQRRIITGSTNIAARNALSSWDDYYDIPEVGASMYYCILPLAVILGVFTHLTFLYSFGYTLRCYLTPRSFYVVRGGSFLNRSGENDSENKTFLLQN